MTGEMRLLLRIFASSAGAADALALGRRLQAELSEFSPREPSPPVRYWKVPEWFEHTLDLQPANATTFDAVVAKAAQGWTHLEREEEFDSVWNHGHGCALLLPEVRWAQLLLINEA